MNRYIFVLCFLISCYGCEMSEDVRNIELGGIKELLPSDKYFEEINLNGIQQSDKLNQYIVFANNPFYLNENFDLVIYLNNQCIYKGVFKNPIQLNLNNLINDEVRADLFFEVFPPPNSKGEKYLHRFITKKTIIWDTNFKFIYVAFFPNNKGIEDRIYFFPQKQDLLS